MMGKINIALIGAGHWGKNLARNFFELGVLHTICDNRQEQLDQFARDYQGVSLKKNTDDLLNDREITAVAIAAPAIMHYTLAKQALLSGKDVFVEKPLCLKCDEAEELVHLAQDREKILMVGHLLQYHPIVIHLQKMIADGQFGKLQYISSHRLSLGQIRTEENNLWSFSPHDISVILSLLGYQLPSTVRCVGQTYLTPNVVDTALMSLQFEHNVHAHIYTNWINPFKEQKLVVAGSSAMAVFDDTKPWDEKLMFYNHPIQWIEGTLPKAQKIHGENIVVAQKEPLREECEHFIQCCLKRTHPKTDGNEGIRVLRVLQAAQDSMDHNGEIRRPVVSSQSYFAHPTSIIDKSADIGAGTKIWHFSHIMNNAVLGSHCNIGQNVVISPGAILGNNVKVQNNVSVYTGVICEDHVFLGPSMVFTNVNNPRSAINRRGEYLSTYVREGATIGANATIVCGNELGAYCFIGAGAVITKDVKPFALMVGNPAKQIGWMSRYGEKLELPVSIESDEELFATCPSTGEIYVLRGNTLALEPAQELQLESQT